jgi:hypothetical protein
MPFLTRENPALCTMQRAGFFAIFMAQTGGRSPGQLQVSDGKSTTCRFIDNPQGGCVVGGRAGERDNFFKIKFL